MDQKDHQDPMAQDQILYHFLHQPSFYHIVFYSQAQIRHQVQDDYNQHLENDRLIKKNREKKIKLINPPLSPFSLLFFCRGFPFSVYFYDKKGNLGEFIFT
jgi:hypothetical protein